MSKKCTTYLHRNAVKFRRGDRMNRSSQSAHYTPQWFLYRRTRIFSPYKFTCTTTWLRGWHGTVRLDSAQLGLTWRGVAWRGVLVVVPRRLGPKIPGTSSTINPAVYRRGEAPGRELVAAARSFPWRSFRLPESSRARRTYIRAAAAWPCGARDDIRRGAHAWCLARTRDTRRWLIVGTIISGPLGDTRDDGLVRGRPQRLYGYPSPSSSPFMRWPGLITGYHKSGSLAGTDRIPVPIEIIRLGRSNLPTRRTHNRHSRVNDIQSPRVFARRYWLVGFTDID